jgi:VanZ family protein
LKVADSSRRSIWRWSLFGVYVALLTFVLLAPHPWAWLKWLRSDAATAPPRLPHWLNDKVQHLGSFGLLGGLMTYAVHRRGLKSAVSCLAAAALYGAMTEYLQGYFPPRTTDWGDLIADSTGALLGISIYWLFAARRSRANGNGASGGQSDKLVHE